jgi:hypothetical protein
MSQETQRFPIRPREVHAAARSSARIHSEADELGRDRVRQRRDLLRAQRVRAAAARAEAPAGLPPRLRRR